MSNCYCHPGRAGGSPLVRGNTVGSLMEGPVGTAPDGVLDNAATHILHHLPFEVRRPPSRKWETLDPVALGGLTACGGQLSWD
jgi:hypothetical protein